MSSATAVYDSSGICFQYPDDWELEETPSEDGVTVSLQSPGSMFLFVNVYRQPVPPEPLVAEALATMEQEYPELDSAPVSEEIASQPAVGRDVNFFSLDLTNTCWIRAFGSKRRTVLVFAQTNDLELESSERAFRAICASLKLTPDGPS